MISTRAARSGRDNVLPAPGGSGSGGTGPGRRKSRAAPPSETQVHLQVADYMRKIGLGPGAIALHVRNETTGKWAKIQAHRLGILPGAPDWLFIANGRAGWVELKRTGWRRTKTRTNNYTEHELRQIEAQRLLRLAGAWVEQCETLDEVLAALRKHKVPLRATGAEQPVITALRQAMSQAELEADAVAGYDVAIRAIGAQVKAGGDLPPLHSHLFHPRRKGGS